MVDDNPRLGPSARSLIEKAAVVYVSAATIWELTIKSMLGKLEIPEGFESLLLAQGITSLTVSAEHAAAIRRFPELLRHDPFERLLVAQAQLERLDLLTADKVLLASGHEFIIDATA